MTDAQSNRRTDGEATRMRDTLEWTSPFGILSAWYLRRFVKRKQSELKRMSEAR